MIICEVLIVRALFLITIGATLMLIGLILYESDVEVAGWILIVFGVCLVLWGTVWTLQRARTRRKSYFINIRSD